MTPEELATRLCRSMWQVYSPNVDLSQDSEFKAIVAALREAIEEERAACATIADAHAEYYCETECDGIAKVIATEIRSRA